MKYIGFVNLENIKEEFESECDNITDEEVLFASYGGGPYDGDAIVLIQRNGKLYTVEGGHCSCYGLNGQWEMIETTKQVLRQRKFEVYDHEEFRNFLSIFLEQNNLKETHERPTDT